MLKLTVAYDGANFAGSQVQPGQRTVQEVLEGALARLFGRQERATFAGRTDRGVHAAGQVVSVVDRQPNLAPEALVRALNAILPDDVAVCRIERFEDAFHARFDARWREYRYRMWIGPRSPIARGIVWRITGRVDATAMRQACGTLIGERDFAAFASGGEGVPWSERQQAPRGTVRQVFSVGIYRLDPWWNANAEPGSLLELRIVADAFLPRMVRNIVGTLVEIGRGAHGPEWVETLLAANDRRQAGMTAPPHGLILWQVGYGDVSPPAS
ncbi:MAG: tRNA pseudouridine(38-40) synthase TruA [Thermomicrobiales bacterium]